MEPIDLDNGKEKEDQDVTGAATSSEVPADRTADQSEDKSQNEDKKSIHSRENDSSDEEEEEKKKRSLRRSPLTMMKKTWNTQILMILMNLWILQEEEGPTTFASNL